MPTESVHGTLERLVHKLQTKYKQSELDIALALAREDGSLSIDELVDETGYTERTVRKRIKTLEEQLQGAPLIKRDDNGDPFLHPELARAIREFIDS